MWNNEGGSAKMQVYDPDGQLVGRVDGMPGSWMHVAGRFMIPRSMIGRIESGRVYPREAARQYLAVPSLASGAV